MAKAFKKAIQAGACLPLRRFHSQKDDIFAVASGLPRRLRGRQALRREAATLRDSLGSRAAYINTNSRLQLEY
jgi:hypothetical protein